MKDFNITGTCIPAKHYMVDTNDKISNVFDLVKRGKYFAISRPRQYGKTTTLYLLEQELLKTDEYLPIKISFEGFGPASFSTEEKFCYHFLDSLGDDRNVVQHGFKELFDLENDQTINLTTLSKVLTTIIKRINKKVVLMIDEVDKASNFDVMIHFLGILREKFLNAQEGRDDTFHSVILAGLHDVKTLKMKIRPESDSKYNSPWNIAIDFKLDMSFNTFEIESMLKQYVSETTKQMDTESISQRLHFWTSGYPFLVSKICKLIDEEINPKSCWSVEDVDRAVDMLLEETNTLFDSMVKNLENNKELYDFIQSVVLGHNDRKFEILTPIINFAHMYGLIDRFNGNRIKIHNKIFEEKITNYMVGKNLIENTPLKISTTQEPYLKPDGKLDFKKVLIRFHKVMKEKYAEHIKSEEFLENELRMLFLMFLQPIINGIGFSFKEVQTGEEKRLDIVVVFKDEKFVIELKLWKGKEYHERGMRQLQNYMQMENIDKGYMLIANKNKRKAIKQEEDNGVFMVWV